MLIIVYIISILAVLDAQSQAAFQLPASILQATFIVETYMGTILPRSDHQIFSISMASIDPGTLIHVFQLVKQLHVPIDPVSQPIPPLTVPDPPFLQGTQGIGVKFLGMGVAHQGGPQVGLGAETGIISQAQPQTLILCLLQPVPGSLQG